eukprot:XP_011661126.1 PREDICTED: protein PFC0760c-like [Strongylocentrotus purpuratus]
MPCCCEVKIHRRVLPTSFSLVVDKSMENMRKVDQRIAMLPCVTWNTICDLGIGRQKRTHSGRRAPKFRQNEGARESVISDHRGSIAPMVQTFWLQDLSCPTSASSQHLAEALCSMPNLTYLIVSGKKLKEELYSALNAKASTFIQDSFPQIRKGNFIFNGNPQADFDSFLQSLTDFRCSDEEDSVSDEDDDVAEEEDGVSEEEDGVLEEEDGVSDEDDDVSEEEDGVSEEEDGVLEEEDGVSEEEDDVSNKKDGISDEEDKVSDMTITGDASKLFAYMFEPQPKAKKEGEDPGQGSTFTAANLIDAIITRSINQPTGEDIEAVYEASPRGGSGSSDKSASNHNSESMSMRGEGSPVPSSSTNEEQRKVPEPPTLIADSPVREDASDLSEEEDSVSDSDEEDYSSDEVDNVSDEEDDL